MADANVNSVEQTDKAFGHDVDVLLDSFLSDPRGVRSAAEVMAVMMVPETKHCFAAALRAHSRQIIAAFGRMVWLGDRCESPIEKYFIAGLYEAGVSTGLGVSVKLKGAWYALTDGEQRVLCEPQYVVGRYRLDFALRYGKHNLAVECDGRDFHQDKAADAARDEDLSALGWRVVRFPGSELFKNPAQCALTALGALANA